MPKPLAEMTNEEIRLEIAERMGMKIRISDGDMDWMNYDRFFAQEGEIFIVKGDNPQNDIPLPNWPEDIAAAWGLWKELPNERRLHQYDEDNNDYHYGNYSVMCGGPCYGAGTDFSYDFREEGTTAPLAICKAWLAWKRSMDK